MFRQSILWLLLFLGMSAIPLVSGGEDAAQAQTRLDELQVDIEQQRQLIESSLTRQEQIERSLQASEEEIGALLQEIQQLQGQLQMGEQAVRLLEEQRAGLEQEKTVQQQLILLELRAVQQMGRASALKMLLNQEDPQLVARMLVYYQVINRARVEKFRKYAATIEQLDQVNHTKAQRLADVRRRRETLASRYALLRETQDRRQQQLEKLNASLGDQNQRLRKLLQDQQGLKTVIQSLVDSAKNRSDPADRIPFHELKGEMLLPVRGGVVNRYGSRRGSSGVRWQGVFIASSEGSPVHAIHGGRVVFAGWLRGFGLMVIINHGSGYMSLYGYNRVLYRELGDLIEAGEVIAETGSSGGQRQSGSYFEIRHNGKPSNPETWCVTRV